MIADTAAIALNVKVANIALIAKNALLILEEIV